MRTLASAHGAAALDTLRGLVGRLKSDDSLAPVTVVVRDNIAAITARRALAHGVGERRGVAAVNVTTLRRVADHLLSLVGSTLPPVTSARLTAVWRAELHAAPGVFELVATHPATVRALARAHGELRGLDSTQLATVAAGGPLAADLVRLHGTVAGGVLAGRRDEAAVLRDATAMVDQDPEVAATLGALILYLPDELDQLETAFVLSLDGAVGVQVIVGTTGNEELDRDLRAQFDAPAYETSTAADADAPATASRVIHASDADDEVRAAVREIVALLAAGTAAHRIAVLYPKDIPYAQLLHDHLAQAGITANGPGVRPLRGRAIADAFLTMLALDPDDLQRVAVFDWLGRAPILAADGSTVPRTQWERLSRDAGITSGDWTTRLDEHRVRLQARLDQDRDDPAVSPGSLTYQEGALDAVAALRAFVGDLTAILRAGRACQSWASLSRWGLDAFRVYFGAAHSMNRLPDPEQRAATAIETTLRGLSELDELGIKPSHDQLIEILDVDLDQRRPRVGRFGDGVFVGPISAAASLDVTDVFLLGLSEDLYPGRQVPDPLLPDAVREAVPLQTSRDSLRAKHRALLAALDGAPRVTASFPRGDLRRGSERLQSRWLMPTLRVVARMPDLEATRWFEASAPEIVSVDSHWRGIGFAEFPSTEQEWRLRHQAGGGHLDDLAIEAAEILSAARLSDDFTRFDGNLVEVEGLPDYAQGSILISPTALERYAGCPHTFFVERLLSVNALENPEEIVTIQQRDIGNIVHETMDGLAREFSDDLPDYGAPWSQVQRERMREIAADIMASYERRGLTGHPRLWEREREALLADLEWILDEDDRARAARDARVVASELAFGLRGAPPVRVEIDEGALTMRGSADRVDETRSGTLVVTDFKTGRSDSFKKIATDPVVGGTKLQLPLYAYAARAAYGKEQVEARYWFVGRRNRGDVVPVVLDENLETVYRAALSTLVRGIREGQFIARPPKDEDWSHVKLKCSYCNPDGVGYGHVRSASARKQTDAALADLFALIDPTIHGVASDDVD
ncbi:PD-(D/E)XK nuclease family protein [Microbacterium sp.]|uniref:PD-(D/E)XK nuclease family protein n=1 Tax=Microbacterium sp. TaxID=51671 RepID=UPI0025FCC6E1|nr:PD-(D/E)XK nuclease family protein [Microbacterium sp.]